jgi:hypothetical protein
MTIWWIASVILQSEHNFIGDFVGIGCFFCVTDLDWNFLDLNFLDLIDFRLFWGPA